MSRTLVVSVVSVALLGTACASRPDLQKAAAPPPRDDLVVVVPDADGKVGAVTVTHGSEQRTLDRAYAAARIREPGRLETGTSSEAEVTRIFAPTVAALPAAPVSFTLYFVFGTDQLTSESRGMLGQVAAEIARRPAAEVVVIGHTDRVGTELQNDALSLQRAERVREDIARQLGIALDRIATAGRGEREPLVPTDDEVAEPRNRRVEITVR